MKRYFQRSGQASGVIIMITVLVVLGGVGAAIMLRRPPSGPGQTNNPNPQQQQPQTDPDIIAKNTDPKSSQQQGRIVGFTTPIPSNTPFPTSIPPTPTDTPVPPPPGQESPPVQNPPPVGNENPNPVPELPPYANCDEDSQEEDIATGCNGNLSGEHFKETFTTSPSGPQSAIIGYPRWFTQPAMQGVFGWDFASQPMNAQHTTGCGPPPGTHAISAFADTVFLCKDHIMTAVNPPSGGTSSGIVVLKPNHLIDLSKGEATIRVDVSTSSPSAGDWWEIWFTPWEDQLVSPTDHWYHHAGRPKTSVQLEIADFPVDNTKRWTSQVYQNHNPTRPEAMDESNAMAFYKGPDFRARVPVSDTRRDTYEVRMTQNHMKLFIKSPQTGNELSLVDEFDIPGGFGSNVAVLQLQHSNYEPEKNRKIGCPGDCPNTTVPATWHWDNVEIYPAIPYKMVVVNEFQIVNGRNPHTLTFREAAPAGAVLMFNGQSVGSSFTLTFNDGTSARATPVNQPNGMPNGGLSHDPDFLTYRVPVPAGATSATIEGVDLCSPANCGDIIGVYGVWEAQNFHIVAR